ncbi:hypothetical protein [Alicyclobacillus acidoterrestris]|uniref:Uncharacterized protein n=1 Tax=Alicyclobacillus acidoterrestris (strain ATCC 49025 / DSM 3922 / CIP 106132 / NCIMB 13137 / GD3B) TaxID=1356854 RepID=T0BUA3_ALIAG|nr:hypothetical protein [Alicyclobacillus acidoterrestris]EPZ47668.1 hypothetical protein N007_05270 [Alicyclobacillus acidoterrestris ATCC 49025]UNO48015.1 hypothetical protein K1I37_15175 [Alicyclobacillus acidoterrestris]
MYLDKRRERLVNILYMAKRRCLNPNDKDFADYGGRGIRVCNDWMENIDSFVDWALNNGYADNLTLDRIDVNGNYEPSNCRWITRKEQHWNKRKTIYLTINSETKSIGEWSEITGIPTNVLFYRTRKGWPEDKLLKPVNKHKKHHRRTMRMDI